MPRPSAAPSLVAVMLSLALVACGSSGTGSPSANSATPTTVATPTESPTPTPLPIAIPRPTDIPTDGTCEQGHICLGLLATGTSYKTQAFEPQITFSVPSAGWENIADEGFVFQLLPISSPGDVIAFFRDPKAADADGSFAEAGTTVSKLSSWLASNALLHVTPAQPVTVGGLNGVTMDITIAAGATSHPADCPVQTCVPIFKEFDASTHPATKWDWGSAGPETQRLYLLSWKDGVIAIFIDSLDGTTFEAMTTAADQIIGTLKFG